MLHKLHDILASTVREATVVLLSLQNWHVVQLKCHVRYIASKPAALPW